MAPADLSAGENRDERLVVEVAYALPERQRIIALRVPPGTTALEAVRQSGISLEFPEIDPATAQLGIFSHPLDGKSLPLPAEYQLRAHDRVEIYRPLLADPKAARARRAAKARKAKQGGAPATRGESEEGRNG
ncbi:MAG TPA: RnfH family protein [Hyphomicrobiales bacterium]|nr:RnfH family protein [Hyphomicrobiales bacterium]